LPWGHVSEVTARVPAALAALVLVALTWDLARRVLRPDAAEVAAIALATSWLVSWFGRRVSLDMLLAATALAAIHACWRAHEALAERRPRAAAGWAVVAGLAT